MRIFLGIEVPESVQTGIFKTITNLEKDYPQAAWINPETFHLTIFFFGERAHTPELDAAIERAVFDIQPFTIHLSSGGLFQTEKLVVMHANCFRVKEAEPVFDRIAGKFAGNAYQKYVPHITFGRYRRSSRQQYVHLKSKLEALDFDFSFPVKQFTLYKSSHDRDMLTYEVLQRYELQP
jgi:2'-5' RNA ligase